MDGHDQHARLRRFSIGQSMMARNIHLESARIHGVIMQQMCLLMDVIDVSDGWMWKCHVDHFKENIATPHLCTKPEAIGNDKISHATAETLEPIFMPMDSLPHDEPEGGAELDPDLDSP